MNYESKIDTPTTGSFIIILFLKGSWTEKNPLDVLTYKRSLCYKNIWNNKFQNSNLSR